MVATVSKLAEKLGHQQLDDPVLGECPRRQHQTVGAVPFSALYKDTLLIYNPSNLDAPLNADEVAPDPLKRRRTGQCHGKLVVLKCNTASKHSVVSVATENTICRGRNGRFTKHESCSSILENHSDLSGSSDDEIREVLNFSNARRTTMKTKRAPEMCTEAKKSTAPLATISIPVNSSAGEGGNRRKRNTVHNRNFIKRQRLSRPSLDFEKMQTAPIVNRVENNRTEIGFFPIHNK